MLYIDTSILVAYYCPEPLSETVQKLLRTDGTPTISPLVEIEFCSALALKVRVRELNKVTANRIVSLFQQHLADGCYAVVPIGSVQYSLARDWLRHFSTPLRALDALHLAAAFTNSLVLVTADDALALSARHFGVEYKLVS